MEPDEPNAVKFETFLFDALPSASRTVSVEVRREDEFSPIKNAEGPDSPATARRDLNRTLRALAGGGGGGGRRATPTASRRTSRSTRASRSTPASWPARLEPGLVVDGPTVIPPAATP